MGWGWECRIPLSSWLGGLGEHLKLPQQGPKQSPEKRFYCFLSVSERFSLEYICISTQSHLFSRTLHVTFQDFPGPRPDFRTFQVIEFDFLTPGPVWTPPSPCTQTYTIDRVRCQTGKKVNRTRLPSVGFQSWSWFLAVSLQVTWVINLALGCHYFPPSLKLSWQPLRGLLPISLLGEKRHNGCE